MTGTDDEGLPPRRADEAIAAALGTDPDEAPVRTEKELDAARARELERDVHGVLRLRRRLGLGQIAFANRYQVPLGTLRNWEQGRRSPTGRQRCCWPRSRPIPRGWHGRPSTPAIRPTSPATLAGRPERQPQAGKCIFQGAWGRTRRGAGAGCGMRPSGGVASTHTLMRMGHA